jgi:hypothetical protein
LGAKHLVEAPRELRVAIPNQESDGLLAIRQRPGQLARLLRDPRRGRRRRTTGQVHPATPQFNEEQHVQPLQPHRVDREEIHGEYLLTVDA